MTFCDMHKTSGCEECPNRWVCDNSPLKVNRSGKDVGKTVNYQIMTDSQKVDGKYIPVWEALLANATSEEEKVYIQEVQKRGFRFAYNMVYVTKQACGHYEIFQTPQNQYYSLESNLALAEETAKDRKCTRCICKW